VNGWTDARGALGTDGDAPVGMATLLSTVRLEVAPGTDAERVQRMLIEAERTCIVLATLRRAVPVYIRIQHNAQAPLALAA
jgi:hypothetical protein